MLMVNISIYQEKSAIESLGEIKQEEVYKRNLIIYSKYKSGASLKELSEIYYLSPKWIQKIF